MKKAIIFSIAMILNGAVFASGLEGFKSQSSLTALNAKTLNDIDVIMPEKTKKINITIIKGRKKQLKYFLVNINGKAVCADKSGKRGYNKMTANELQSLPQTAECAYLSRADLEWANLAEANFSGAYLRGANLRWAYLRSANLRKAYMRGTNFSGADLTRADLRGNLNGADLSGADLRWANLSGADLSDADFNGANLRGANLEGAYLTAETYMVATDLRGANLRGINLEKAELSLSKLNGAKYNNKTILPFDEETAKKKGMIKVQ